jgi:RNA polymerase sigma-70 factor (family 1)
MMIVNSEKTDAELMQLIKLGDHQAFTAIYIRYWKALLAIAFNYTKDKSIAEEVVQDLFISVWNRKDDIEIHSFQAYMATAVKFSIFKYISGEAKRRKLAETKYNQPTTSIDDKQIEALFLQEYIDGVVEQLPEKCRLVFKFSRQAGKNIPEIARIMGISEKTVEAHLTKGLKTLKMNLKNAGILALLLIFHLVKKNL